MPTVIAPLRTECIKYGDQEWKTTPLKKQHWENFWKKVLAQAEKNRYSN